MMKNKDITFLIKVMNGGGAERVISILSQALVARGYQVNLVLTHQKISEAKLSELDERIQVISIEDTIGDEKVTGLKPELLMLKARVRNKFAMKLKNKSSDLASIEKYHARNYKKVSWL